MHDTTHKHGRDEIVDHEVYVVGGGERIHKIVFETMLTKKKGADRDVCHK